MPAWILAIAALSVAVTAALTWILYRINPAPTENSENDDAGQQAPDDAR